MKMRRQGRSIPLLGAAGAEAGKMLVRQRFLETTRYSCKDHNHHAGHPWLLVEAVAEQLEVHRQSVG